MTRLLDEMFVMRLNRRMSVRRALAYLAVIGVALWYVNRREMAQPALFAKDMHAELSLDLAVDRWDPLESTCRHASLSIL